MMMLTVCWRSLFDMCVTYHVHNVVLFLSGSVDSFTIDIERD